MTGSFILAIDQGTTSSRALVLTPEGKVAGLGREPLPQHFPEPGRVEHDLREIWATTDAAIARALGEARIGPWDLAAVGIANQRETVGLWERATGEPVAPAIVWQDRRTAGVCEELRAAGQEETFRQATGLTLDPYFSGTKLTWMLRERPDLRARAEAGELAAGTVDSWLAWKLTDGQRHVTDYTNASRTLLFNIARARWERALCDLLEVPRALLATPQPSRSPFGVTAGSVFKAEVPILAVAGDQQAALFGQLCTEPGQAKNTYGTGSFLLANAGRRLVLSENRLLTSVGAGAGPAGPEYVLEGSVFVAGSLVQWLRDELRLVKRSEDVEALAASVPDSGGVTVVPAFAGLGAPYWDPHARGAILGLTLGTTAAHVARAALEAIALSNAELFDAIQKDLPEPVRELRVDGGAARNDLLMQTQADAIGIPVVRPRQVETTALGAAYLAGLSAGVWPSVDDLRPLWDEDRTFEPRWSEAERHERLERWRRVVARTLSGNEPG